VARAHKKARKIELYKRALQIAEKLWIKGKKRQGTTLVVPKTAQKRTGL